MKVQTHLGCYGFLCDGLSATSETASSPAHTGRKLSVTSSCTSLTPLRQCWAGVVEGGGAS